MMKINLYNSAEWIGHTTARILNKHTDIVSSSGILVITTCLLAAKIFNNIPVILPRVASLVYNFGGIIWLNVQVREMIKSVRDFRRAFWHDKAFGIVETAVKVGVKSVNIFLTCAIFSASVLSVSGYAQAALGIHLAMRGISLSTLALSAGLDVHDYFANADLVQRLEMAEKQEQDEKQVGKIVLCFSELLFQTNTDSRWRWPQEYWLADRLIRQLDNFTVETFEENLRHKSTKEPIRIAVCRIFYSLKESMLSKQAFTKDNLSLTVLGYFSRAICRAFPETVIEMATRWGMSVLYTDELIRQKFCEADLAESLK